MADLKDTWWKWLIGIAMPFIMLIGSAGTAWVFNIDRKVNELLIRQEFAIDRIGRLEKTLSSERQSPWENISKL